MCAHLFSAVCTGMAGNSYVPGSRGFGSTMGFFGNGIDYMAKCAYSEGDMGASSWHGNCKTYSPAGAKKADSMNMHLHPPRFSKECTPYGEEIVGGCITREECNAMKDGTYRSPWGIPTSSSGNEVPKDGGGDYSSVNCNSMPVEPDSTHLCTSAYDRFDPELGDWDGGADGGDCEIAYDWCAAVELDLLHAPAHLPPRANIAGL